MPLPVPNLDDRSFAQLLAEARARIDQSCPAWTDRSASDPGMVILDVFAYLTEVMLYRLNRIPEKAYVEFLNLIGVRLHPPAAAEAMLQFHRDAAGTQPVQIPRGTRVTLARPNAGADAPVFATIEAVTLAGGSTDVTVKAIHADDVEGEKLGTGTGLPGQAYTVMRPPIIASTEDGLGLVVGVEAGADELGERVNAREYQGKTYRIWREVSNFSNLGVDRFVFIADRTAGLVTFAPAARVETADGQLADQPQALAEVPGAGRDILAWYWCGGGAAGNVNAGTLTVIKDPVAGVNLQVQNPAAASGGRATETTDNARIRGPQTLHSSQTVIIASDYETVATQTASGIARAQAFTRAELWRFAQPGTVEVLLVPDLPESERPGGRVSAAALQQRQTDQALQTVIAALEPRLPLGTYCDANWTNLKTARVSLRAVVRREEDADAVRGRVLQRLYQTISPLPSALNSTGWQFGQALRASNVYDIVLREPGVRWLDRVKLQVEEVPQAVGCVAADPFQDATWYAGSDSSLYRSLNNGDSWEQIGTFPQGVVNDVRPHPGQAGLVAVSVQSADGTSSNVRITRDCGETWDPTEHPFGFVVRDLAWIDRGGVSFLLLATDGGLYELAMTANASPVQVVVDPSNQSRPLYSIAVAQDTRTNSVAIATQAAAGVFLSTDFGRTGTFQNIALQGEDVRVLAVQYDGPRSFVWAGETVAGGDEGKGCFRWETTDGSTWPNGWEAFSNGWTGGSVRSLAFLGTTVFAASHHAGVLSIDSRSTANSWLVPAIGCGLPLREREQFQFWPVDSVAAAPRRSAGGTDDQPNNATALEADVIMAGVTALEATGDNIEDQRGVFRSFDDGSQYERVSRDEFLDTVNVPPTWLLCSGEHDVVVETEDAIS